MVSVKLICDLQSAQGYPSQEGANEENQKQITKVTSYLDFRFQIFLLHAAALNLPVRAGIDGMHFIPSYFGKFRVQHANVFDLSDIFETP